jgi:outer membrane protein assembly factor BamB
MKTKGDKFGWHAFSLRGPTRSVGPRRLGMFLCARPQRNCESMAATCLARHAGLKACHPTSLTRRVLMLALALLLACRASSAAENEGPPPTFEEAAFQGRPARSNLPVGDALRMLEAVGQESRISPGYPMRPRLRGLFRVRDWTPDSAVRVAVTDPSQHWRVIVWGEGQGVMIFFSPFGAAYRIAREPTGPETYRDLRASLSALITTDDRRGVRMPESAYQIRCQDGGLVVTKGDVRLMTVPLEGPAKRLYIEAPDEATLGDLAVFRSAPAPKSNFPFHRIVLDGAQPGQLPWKESLPPAARFKRLADGCVELSADNTTKQALATVDVAGPGLYEVIAEVDEATAGSGLALLNAKGEPLEGIEFGREGKEHAFGYGSPREQPWLGNFDFNNRPVALAGPRQWLRLVVAGGWSKCWISGDGAHWGSVLDCRDRSGSWQSIALYVREMRDRRNPESPTSHIRIRSLQVRELTGLTSAVAADLPAQAAAVGVAMKFEQGESAQAWTERIARLAPKGTSPAAWRYACTLQALAAPIRGDEAETLLDRAVREQLSELKATPARIDLLQDAALVWRPRREDAQRQLELWDQLAREVLNTGGAADFDRCQEAAAQASLGDPPERYGAISWELARDAVILFYIERQGAEMSRMERKVAFWRASDPQFGGWPATQQLEPLRLWLGVHRFHRVGRRMTPTIDNARTLSPPLNRPASSIIAEVQSAVEGKQYADAARILITSEPPVRGSAAVAEGLVPSPDDDRLFGSYPSVLRQIIQGHPELSEAMTRQIGPADQLKIEQALAHGDPNAVEALPLHYCGTPAAAIPCQWLGDRALAAADAAQAASWYGEGLRWASPSQQPDLAARKRLAAAMQGSAEGRPPTQAVSFGGMKVSPEQFEGWVRVELARRRAPDDSATTADPLAVIRVPQPVDFQASMFGELHDDGGRSVRTEELPQELRDIDWSWRHLTLRTAGNWLLAVHRTRIAALDLAGGRLRWEVQLGNSWSLGPVRPLICNQRIYLRAAASSGTGVICLEAKTGRKLWTADSGGPAVADPLFFQGRLFALAFGPAEGPLAATLCLVELNPETGEVLSRRPIVETLEPETLRTECQASMVGDRIVILLAGNVVCTDLQGRMIWLRQATSLPGAVNPAFLRQQCQPAIESGGRLFVQQPGSCAIDCLEAETGQCRWRRGIIGLQSIVDLPDERLLARTTMGFVAVNKATGEVLWQRDVPDVLSALARTTSGLILCSRHAIIRDKAQIIYLWIDAATGRTRAHSVTMLERKEPVMFGPILASGDRLWYCFGYGSNGPPSAENDKRIIELRPGSPAVADEGP